MEAPELTDEPAVESASRLRGLRDLWQIPTVLGAVLLLFMGMFTWVRTSAPPDIDAALETVAVLLGAEEYEEAKAILNGPILSYMQDPTIHPETLAYFYTLRGDTLYLDQRDRNLDLQANNEQILSNYEQARRFGAKFGDVRLYRNADTLLRLGRTDEALSEARLLSDQAAKERREIFRRVIEAGLAHGSRARDRGLASDLIAEMHKDPTLDDAGRRWLVAREARLSLQAGYPEDAMRRVLPELQRLPENNMDEGAELLLVLGAAYLDVGRFEDAYTQAERALNVLLDTDPLVAEAALLQGSALRIRGEYEQARDQFAIVTTRFPQSDAGARAYLALGEINAELGHHEIAQSAYRAVVDRLRAGRLPPDLGAEQIEFSLGERHDERFERGDIETALEYARLSAACYRDGEMPAQVHARLASAHRAMGDRLLAEAPRTSEGAIILRETDPITLEHARRHYADASRFAGAHARATLLSDPELSASALWMAAECAEQAGDLVRAAELFNEYVQARHNDPRALEGQYRHAGTLKARGQYMEAIKIYEGIIDGHPRSIEAYRSYIPLAHCYLLLGDPDSLARAEQRLHYVISGEPFEPNAPEFRQGLLELANLYRRTSRYPEAIRRLSEARARFPDLESSPSFLFNLAESNRLAASEAGERLREAMPQSERRMMFDARTERLEQALSLYDTVRATLSAQDPKLQTPIERTMLRNAMFFRGDCAYDLALHHADDQGLSQRLLEEAIRFYDAAAQRYAEDPSSLVAMVQIVNCYVALGKWREAATAHERARARLAEIPNDAWERADTPMSRRHWEQWLESSFELRNRGTTASSAG